LELLFAHWPIESSKVRNLVPAPLDVQEFQGTSYVGLVPFRMAGVMRRPLPDLPYVSAFPEINLRLYVEFDGRPGVWFLSLDADNALAVWAARRFFNLPYHRARMSIEPVRGGFEYRSTRRGSSANFVGHYAPCGPVFEASPGSVEHFLTERYCLYAQDRLGRLWRNDVHHVPWPLQRATAEIERVSLFEPHGLKLDGPPPLLHFASRLDVVVYDRVRVA
jgi:uncharacterized protein YqjF (DUF2071 family)